MRSISTTTLAPVSTASLTSGQHSSWHSPVPYLFGGLAAMLGLVAFALLILACSYWKLFVQLEQNEENRERDLESGEKEGGGDSAKSVKVFEEKILVIMAGDENPTFLATPVCPKSSSSFPDGVGNHFAKDLQNHETCEKSEKEMENPLQQPPTTTQPPQETQQQSQCQ